MRMGSQSHNIVLSWKPLHLQVEAAGIQGISNLLAFPVKEILRIKTSFYDSNFFHNVLHTGYHKSCQLIRAACIYGTICGQNINS